MKVVYCFITKNRHGCDSRQVCFQTERNTYIHSYTHYCVYIQGALHTGGISGVFLVNLKIGLLHYEKPYSCINQMQHLHACSSLMFWPSMVWISIPENMHYFNQFVYAGYAAKSVKPQPRSESWLDRSDEEGSQSVFWKANPSLSTLHDF